MRETEAARQWVAHWQRVGPLLEQLKADELREMTLRESASRFEALAELATEINTPPLRSTSGFVEQQRLFLKLLPNGPAN
jgi:hypothetical protein